MTERIDPGGGGMTGATGDLTPEGPEQSFVPGERREVEDPEARGTVTYRQATGAPSQRGEAGDPAGEESRMEVNPLAAPTPNDERHRVERGPRIGGDELKDEEEHF